MKFHYTEIKVDIVYIPPILPNIGGDPKPKLLDWPLIVGLPNPVVVVAPNPVGAEAPNPEFATPKPVFVVLEIHKK